MERLRGILGNRRLQFLMLGVLLAGAGGLFFAWKLGVNGESVKSEWQEVENFLMLRPWLLFGTLVVLPGLPISTAVLLFLVGAMWRDRPMAACLMCLVALALNMVWTYWLAAGFGRRLVVRLLAWIGLKVPELHEDNQLLVILLIRLTPGFPFFAQNYLLGLLRVPFRLYLGVSLGCNGIMSAGVVLSAAGMADGNWIPLLAGGAFLITGLVLVRRIRRRMLRGRSVDVREPVSF